MPGFLTNRINDQVLDCLFGGGQLVAAEVLYVGLSLAKARRCGHVQEPSAPSYFRSAVPNHSALFPASRGGSKGNAFPIAFAAPAEDWGEIRSVFIADAPTGGLVLAAADLPLPTPIVAGERGPIIRPGALYLSHY